MGATLIFLRGGWGGVYIYMYQRSNRTSEVPAVHYLNKNPGFIGLASTRTISGEGNEKLPPTHVSFQRNTMERVRTEKTPDKRSATCSGCAKIMGIAIQKQPHVKIPVETQ